MPFLNWFVANLSLHFVIRLSGGETHEVRHPECILVTKTRVVITNPQEDRIAVCSLMHVTSVDYLQPT
jgi:hypothetical protein